MRSPLEFIRNRAPAISGQGGHEHTYATAMKLHDMGVPLDSAKELMNTWNTTCQPPWETNELANIVVTAYRLAVSREPVMDKCDAHDFNVPQKPDALEKLKKLAAGVKTETKETNPKDAVGIRKPRFFSGLSWHVMRLVSIGMMEGAMKYGRHNYRPAAVRGSVYFDATLEHLTSWYEGEDIDPDSKLNHVIKAIASLMVLADAIVTGNLVDDRPPRTADVSKLKAGLQPLVDDLFNRYPNPVPAYTDISVKTGKEK